MVACVRAVYTQRAAVVIIAPDELGVIMDALREAADYRWQLAGSCPRDCMGHGTSCADCEEHQDAAEAYQHLESQLSRSDRRRRVTSRGEGEVRPIRLGELIPPPRDAPGETTVKVKGDLL
jgi:hypothetical protein